MPDTRASNPTSSGPSLLDKSTARPADVDMAIFEKQQAQSGSPSAGASQKSQGAVNANYLEECRRDNPSPTDEKTAKRTVTLSDCRIDTPPEDLATDQPFKMSCVATSSDGKPVPGGVTFRLYCTLPDGTEEDTGLAKIGKREGDRICAEGTLYSPKKLVEWGEMLIYHVVAEHPGAEEKAKSGVAEVVGYMPPKPVGVWTLSEADFFDDTPFIKLCAVDYIAKISQAKDQSSNICLIIQAFQDSSQSRDLSYHRALSLYYLMTKNTHGWWSLLEQYTKNRSTKTFVSYMKQEIRKNRMHAQSSNDWKIRVVDNYFDLFLLTPFQDSNFAGSLDDDRFQSMISICGSIAKNKKSGEMMRNSSLSLIGYLAKNFTLRIPCPSHPINCNRQICIY